MPSEGATSPVQLEAQNDPIEVDSQDTDAASDYGSLVSDLTSVTSSVLNYQYENGRRYHAYRSGKYVLPNDEEEQERLDLLHHVFRLTLDGGLTLSELKSPQNILDVGTGTGIWAVESEGYVHFTQACCMLTQQVAEEYPEAYVIGTDLSPIQPNWIPPNLSFQVDDAEDDWTFQENSFDLIHARCMAGSIKDWPKFLEQCYKHLKPGGKIELAEGRTHMDCDDDTFPKDCHTRKWIAEFHRITRAAGLDFDAFPTYPSLLKAAGFTNPHVSEKVCPIGTWPKDRRLKEIGKYFRVQFLEGAVDSYSMAVFTRMGGWSEEETRVLLALVRNEVKGGRMHVYTHCSYVSAEKPLDG